MATSKRFVIFGLMVVAGVLLLSATRNWIRFELVEGAATVTHLEVSGQVAATGILPISLALLAIAVTLSIAGRAMRVVLGALIVLLGAWVSFSSFQPISGGTAALVRTAATELSSVTGLGPSEHDAAVAGASPSAWPAVAGCFGVLVIVIGVVAILRGRTWKAAGQKYTSGSRAHSRSQNGGSDRISDWDALSDGADPSLEEDTVTESRTESPGSSSPDSSESR